MAERDTFDKWVNDPYASRVKFFKAGEKEIFQMNETPVDGYYPIDYNRHPTSSEPIDDAQLRAMYATWVSTYVHDEINSYESAEKWLKEWHGYKYVKGKGYGYYYNPKAKWDWYELGGRWRGCFKLKNKNNGGKLGRAGVHDNEQHYDVDQVLKGDVDWDGMKQANREDAEWAWDECQAKLKEDPKSVHPYFQCGIEEGDTKDVYVARCALTATFAVLKDGKWYERGEVGWWGCVLDEKDKHEWNEQFEKLLADLPDDTLLSVYDCHI